MGSIKHLEYYWTTTQDREFHNGHKFFGDVLITDENFVLGVLKNNIDARKHLICGINIQEFLFIKLCNFKEDNIELLKFPKTDEYEGKIVGDSSQIGYTTGQQCPARIEFSNAKICEKEHILKEVATWFQGVTQDEIAYFNHYVEGLLCYLNTINSKNPDELARSYFMRGNQCILKEQYISPTNQFISSILFPFKKSNSDSSEKMKENIRKLVQ